MNILSVEKNRWQEWESLQVARVDWVHSDHKLVKSIWIPEAEMGDRKTKWAERKNMESLGFRQRL